MWCVRVWRKAYFPGSISSKPFMKIFLKMCLIRAPPASSVTGRCSLQPSSICVYCRAYASNKCKSCDPLQFIVHFSTCATDSVTKVKRFLQKFDTHSLWHSSYRMQALAFCLIQVCYKEDCCSMTDEHLSEVYNVCLSDLFRSELAWGICMGGQ